MRLTRDSHTRERVARIDLRNAKCMKSCTSQIIDFLKSLRNADVSLATVDYGDLAMAVMMISFFCFPGAQRMWRGERLTIHAGT